MTSTETTVETSITDQYFRLVDHDGRWSVYKGNPSGASVPVLPDTTERIARMVLAELQDPSAGAPASQLRHPKRGSRVGPASMTGGPTWPRRVGTLHG